MKYLVFLSVLILFAACSDSPDSPPGTLPIVQNCRIMETECKGDTVIVAWDAVTVEVDGYRVWFSDTDPGDWSIISQVEGTITQHIATSTGYYCVDAIKGIDSSEDQSNKANDRAEMYLIDDTLTVGATNGLQFQASHTALGDATDPSFAQDLYIAKSGDTILFYSGNSDPAIYPGGTGAMIALSSNYLAPGPGDAAWKNSSAAQNASGFFVQLRNGDFAHFWVDTVAADFVVLNSSQYQDITGLRLFNPFIF
ncbi:MAG: hypothetical protein KAH54_04130 [Candidatus Sabulitectum sp.]|nr:hypothetical protein [Candidatus Sabulitectum sp.]